MSRTLGMLILSVFEQPGYMNLLLQLQILYLNTEQVFQMKLVFKWMGYKYKNTH